ncbi:carbohydrate kinase family protein [Dactylosporangium vinaceum]|uniref:Carbohydrate kinase family protein n=1 Tax=Dactylosporangium vinaceum TaxID=53362 RepID=A0ABV5MBK6_9ACTN|nr:carbohydrate kinase family protein [Dactylosporangium vinaceum]UAB98466.1 carbohydrate kinase family protein [Dactylosporangium vinaceum]
MDSKVSMDVLVVGDANPDLVLRGDVRPRFGQEEQLLDAADLVLGGSAAITAMGCARLGLRTGLLAAVGADVFGTFTRARLEERGVRLLAPAADVTMTPTGLSVILSAPGDRAILTLPGTIPALRPEDVTDELLAGARHVHVSSLFLQPGLHAGLAGVFKRARALGVSTSLDTNWDPSGQWAGLEEILAVTDVFLPNAAELLAVTRAGTMHPAADVLEAAAEQLVVMGTAVVLKDGARGGRAWWLGSGGAVVAAAAPGVAVDVVDTTGAGDSFNAGFLAARLGGLDIAGALGWAARAGSLSTRAAGGTAAQATREEVIPSAR